MLWEKAVLALLTTVAVVAVLAVGAGFALCSLIAAIATSASAAPRSNLVEICMLTHTSASRSRANVLRMSR
jgi:hypothetical protein